MISRLMQMLRGQTDDDAGRRADIVAHAVACLLVEAAVTDGDFDAAEEAVIRRLLVGRFGLDDQGVGALIEEAAAEMAESVELWSVARTVGDAFSPEERVGMIEMLWEVVYADGRLDDYEANLLRRIAGLIYVPDVESGAARLRVLKRLGLQEQ